MRFSVRWLVLPALLAAALVLRSYRRILPAATASAEAKPGSLKPFWISAACAVVLLAGYGGSVAIEQKARNEEIARAITHGDMTRAPALLRRYGCGGCHSIGGVPGADGQVGGSLDGLRKRVFIAGVAPNSPRALISWIVAPQSLSPQSAMPRTGITREEARDVAAFLYAQ